MVEVVLASASPRRRELLGLIVPAFTVVESGADETGVTGKPQDMVQALARLKARSVAESRPGSLVIGADTVVVLNGQTLGKPADAADAARMLRLLSGNTHHVLTGVCVITPGGEETFCESTAVTFVDLDDGDIAGYVATGEPLDKAGAYGIQGGAARFVRCIQGDYHNVVGLPVCALWQRLKPWMGK